MCYFLLWRAIICKTGVGVIIDLIGEPGVPAEARNEAPLWRWAGGKVVGVLDSLIHGHLGYEILILRASGHDGQTPGLHVRDGGHRWHGVSWVAVGVKDTHVPRERARGSSGGPGWGGGLWCNIHMLGVALVLPTHGWADV